MIRRNFMHSTCIPLLVPISVHGNWGICIAKSQSGRGTISRGDGLDWKIRFAPVLSVVYDTMKHCFPHIRWLKSENKYMLQNLEYAGRVTVKIVAST